MLGQEDDFARDAELIVRGELKLDAAVGVVADLKLDAARAGVAPQNRHNALDAALEIATDRHIMRAEEQRRGAVGQTFGRELDLAPIEKDLAAF